MGNRHQTSRANYSGKQPCQGLSLRVACDLDGVLIAPSTPVPGARHDAAAIELTGWQHTLRDASWVPDSAYQATTAIIPIRKPLGAELPHTAKQFNRQLSPLRCVVERRLSHLKNWRIFSRGYRRPLKRFPLTIALITKLELYRLRWQPRIRVPNRALHVLDSHSVRTDRQPRFKLQDSCLGGSITRGPLCSFPAPAPAREASRSTKREPEPRRAVARTTQRSVWRQPPRQFLGHVTTSIPMPDGSGGRR
jgi:hypothetical protein